MVRAILNPEEMAKYSKNTKSGVSQAILLCLLAISLSAFFIVLVYKWLVGENVDSDRASKLLDSYNHALYHDVSLKPKQHRGGSRFCSKGEDECRRFLEERFGRDFSSIRPDWLKNPIGTGKNLELDCYNRELGLAVEFNGIQHYKFTKRFHSSQGDFNEQKYRDVIKRQACKERGITLIEVPYYEKNISGFLSQKLAQLGYG